MNYDTNGPNAGYAAVEQNSEGGASKSAGASTDANMQQAGAAEKVATPKAKQAQAAQGLVDNLMGEQSGMFKNIMSTLGLDDNEFWKGAAIGAVAALVLSNENVRTTLLNVLGSAGDALKSAGGKVKDAAATTVSSAKEGVSASSKIVRDTVKAGKDGFETSVSEVRENKSRPAAKKTAFKSHAVSAAPKKTATTKKRASEKTVTRKTAETNA